MTVINRIRDLILNLAPVECAELTEAEQIQPDFVPVEFPAGAKRVHAVLFDGTSTIRDKIFCAFQLYKLTQSTELESYLTILGNVPLIGESSISYFKDVRVFDLVQIDVMLRDNRQEVAQLVALAKKYIDPEKVKALEHIRMSHSNPIYRVGAVTTLLVLVAEVLNQKRTANVRN